MSNLLTIEAHTNCPYCDAPISLLLDASIEQQTYIEDCEVCCQPVTVRISFSDDDTYSLQLLQENEV
jgi:hypothetical protein